MPASGDPLRVRYLAVGMTDVPDHDRWLTEPEAERLRAFPYVKRRDEARLGRWTAKQALAMTLGREPTPETLRALVVRNAADGAPEVFVEGRPAPLSISMTDRADWAVCAVVAGTTSIGCDLELVEPRSAAFVRDWFTPAEQSVLAERPGDHDLLANLIWSAKESALKVLRTGLRRDTRSVEVCLAANAAPAGGDGWQALTVTTAEGESLPGWWSRFDRFLLTFAARDATDPPATLVDPAPLQAAIPGHRWMDSGFVRPG